MKLLVRVWQSQLDIFHENAFVWQNLEGNMVQNQAPASKRIKLEGMQTTCTIQVI
jgi:hypothetical protein